MQMEFIPSTAAQTNTLECLTDPQSWCGMVQPLP